MNAQGILHVEQELGVKIPSSFRELALNQGDELRSMKNVHGVGHLFDLTLFVEPERLIEENLHQRAPDSWLGDCYPDWWKEYFLVGCSGANDYYALRLDNTHQLWVLSPELGDIHPFVNEYSKYVGEPVEEWEELPQDKIIQIRTPVTLEDYVAEHLKQYHHDLENYEPNRQRVQEEKTIKEMAERWVANLTIEPHEWVGVRKLESCVQVSQGKYESLAAHPAQPGVYVVFSCDGQVCKPIDCGEASNLAQTMTEIDRYTKWRLQKEETLFSAEVFTGNSSEPERQELVKRLLKQMTFRIP